MNRLSQEERARIIASLCEGNSLRATARLCDVAFNTVLKLLPEVGKVCADYQARGSEGSSARRDFLLNWQLRK